MRNPEATKDRIIVASANLFNTKGYQATSISDITKATGLTKGAIYRHFTNKEDLEKQALRSLSYQVFTQLRKKIKDAPNFKDKMEAVFTFFEHYLKDPVFEGGCPLLNVAIESDDAHPALKAQAQEMLTRLRSSISTLMLNGIKNNQVQPEINVAFYATIFIATLEGGIMMSKLEANQSSLRHAITHLRQVVQYITI
ncbi:MAG: TetR/AcrR family transcriptional regulator [Dokdonia sp.]